MVRLRRRNNGGILAELVWVEWGLVGLKDEVGVVFSAYTLTSKNLSVEMGKYSTFTRFPVRFP